MKRIESLIKIAGIKFEFKNLEIRFHKRQVSFLVIKTVKCKRGISEKFNFFNTGCSLKKEGSTRCQPLIREDAPGY